MWEKWPGGTPKLAQSLKHSDVCLYNYRLYILRPTDIIENRIIRWACTFSMPELQYVCDMLSGLDGLSVIYIYAHCTFPVLSLCWRFVQSLFVC